MALSGKLSGVVTIKGKISPNGGLNADYNILSNKPKIEGITLEGNLSTEDLNLVSKDALAATIAALNSQLFSTIANVPINTSTGSMELWSQNLNNVTTSGFYNAMTCINAKYTYSTLIVIGYYLTGYCTQIQCDVITGAIATRTQINGTWSAWKVIDTNAYSVIHDGNGTVTVTDMAAVHDGNGTVTIL